MEDGPLSKVQVPRPESDDAPRCSGTLIRAASIWCPYSFSCFCRDAWHALGDMAPEDAAHAYIDLVSAFAPDWLSWSGNKWLCALVVRSARFHLFSIMFSL